MILDKGTQIVVTDTREPECTGFTGAVAVVEFYAAGHHAQYITDIASGFDSLKVDASFFVSSDLAALLSGHRVRAIPHCDKLLGLRGWRRHAVAKKLCNDAIRMASSEDMAVVHFVYADWHLSAIASAWKKSKPPMRIVCTIHWTAGAGLGRGIYSRLRGLIHLHALKWLVSHADIQVQVHHEAVKQAISRYVPSERISVVPYPTHAPGFASAADCARFRSELGVTDDVVLLLCYGGMRYDKGADLAIKALALLPMKFHLLIAGNPGYFNAENLQRIADVAGVRGRVHVLPRFLDDKDTALVFATSNIILFPYRKIFSGQSGPLMQAAALGKMVVVPSSSVLCETVGSFKLGDYFDAENIDSMARVIKRVEHASISPMDTAYFRAQHAVGTFVEKLSLSYTSINFR